MLLASRQTSWRFRRSTRCERAGGHRQNEAPASLPADSRATSNQEEDQQHRDWNSQEPEKNPPEFSGLRCSFAEILHVLESP